VRPAAEVRPRDSRGRAHHRGDGDRDDGDLQRCGRARGGAGEHVAAELVGAEPVPRRRAGEPFRGGLGERVAQEAERGGERAERDDGDEHGAGGAGAAGERAADQAAPPARAGELDRGAALGRGGAGGGGHAARTRGSITRYSRSVPRLTSTNVSAITSTVLCTTAYSFCWMPSSTCLPMPGTEKICSTTTAPPSR